MKFQAQVPYLFSHKTHQLKKALKKKPKKDLKSLLKLKQKKSVKETLKKAGHNIYSAA